MTTAKIGFGQDKQHVTGTAMFGSINGRTLSGTMRRQVNRLWGSDTIVSQGKIVASTYRGDQKRPTPSRVLAQQESKMRPVELF